MQKNVAIALAIALLLAVFWLGMRSNATGGGLGLGTISSPLPFSDPKLANLGQAFTTASAWGTFQEYLQSAKAHDIAKIKKLSYQMSPVCQAALEGDAEEDTRGCIELMDSVSLVASGFRQEDFVNVASDEKQIIMSTNYLGAEGASKTKTVLYFVKASDGSPKVLGIRFCYGDESDAGECVRTEPETRDTDKDGWWDDVETLFRSN